jgi:hypothetical protein
VGCLCVYLRLRHLAWRFDWGWLAVSLIHVHLCIYIVNFLADSFQGKCEISYPLQAVLQ